MDNYTIDISKDPSAHGGIFCLRTLLLLAIVLLLGHNSFSQARIKVEESFMNFGKIKKGNQVECIYEISNVGDQPLIITSTEVSCSCTTVDYPKQPIVPNQKAEINVKFNTESAIGRQDRVILVHSNDPRSPLKLRYKGVVLKDK